jgi:hypothetical protein
MVNDCHPVHSIFICASLDLSFLTAGLLFGDVIFRFHIWASCLDFVFGFRIRHLSYQEFVFGLSYLDFEFGFCVWSSALRRCPLLCVVLVVHSRC